MKEIRRIFRELDEDGSGVLNKEELRVGLPKLSSKMPDLNGENFDQMFEVMDADQDGSISYSEFISAGMD